MSSLSSTRVLVLPYFSWAANRRARSLSCLVRIDRLSETGGACSTGVNRAGTSFGCHCWESDAFSTTRSVEVSVTEWTQTGAVLVSRQTSMTAKGRPVFPQAHNVPRLCSRAESPKDNNGCSTTATGSELGPVDTIVSCCTCSRTAANSRFSSSATGALLSMSAYVKREHGTINASTTTVSASNPLFMTGVRFVVVKDSGQREMPVYRHSVFFARARWKWDPLMHQ